MKMEYLKIVLPFIVGVSTAPVVEFIKNRMSSRRNIKCFEMEIRNEKEELVKDILQYYEVLVNNYDYGGLKGLRGKEDDFSIHYENSQVNIVFLDMCFQDLYYKSSKANQYILKMMNAVVKDLEDSRLKIVNDEIEICETEVCEEETPYNKGEVRNEKISSFFEYIYSGCLLVNLIDSFLNNKNVDPSPEKGAHYVEKICKEIGVDYKVINSAKQEADKMKRL